MSMDEEIGNMIFAGGMSVLFVYFLMGFLFESFILPLSIILTIPLAGIGVAWIHYVTGKDIDFLGIVGAILLVGVVVKNGIVLIDYVIRLRAEGMERTQALLTSSKLRFRPIMMTALTTIIGMIPLTFARPNDMGLSYKSFGLTLIGGMTTATLLTMLVVPVFYTFFDDARVAFMRVLRLGLVTKVSGQVMAPAAAEPASSVSSE
jgi:HAE1 family hydrophobic/amphiphilic exporter-1